MKIDNAKTKAVPKELEAKPLSKRVSMFQEGNRYEIIYVKIESIVPFKHQARKYFNEDEIQSLAETIKDHGIRQPLTLLAKPDDTYEVVSGERRLRAAKIAGLNRVPAIIIYDEFEAEKIALIENIQRTDLSLLELGEGLTGLLEREIFASQSDISRKLGIPRTKISEAISLSKLSPAVKDLISEKKINNRDLLREVVAAAAEDKQKLIINESQTVSDQENTSKPKETKLKHQSKSILRIIKDRKGVRIQNFDMSVLESHEKELIRESLEKILKSLI